MSPVSRSRRLWVVVSAVAAIALVPTGASAQNAIRQETVAEINRYVEAQLDQNGVPGAALAIVERGRAVELRGFGTARDDEPATAETPFLIGSVTKSFTSLAVMELVEDGEIELDAPITRYLPWFEVRPSADTDAVTVRHLLNQTSGLSTQAGGAELRYLEDESILATAESLIGSELQSEPGTEFEYANANLVLLGAAIEAASRESYQGFVQTRILDPLGMRSTYLALEPARDAGMADGHRYWFGWTAPHTSFAEGLIPAGGVISTAEDMARYMRMFLNHGELDGERILSRAGIETLQMPVAAAELGPWARDRDAAYAMGLFVGSGPFGSEPAVFHPGGSPDFGAMMVLLPDREQGLTLLYNATPEINLPGAAGALDRIPAGAVSILIGAEPATGWSMHDYYLAFDAITLALFALALWALVRAIRRAPAPAPSRLRRAVRVTRAAGALLLGALLIAAPILTGVGWRVMFLSVPDLALVLAALGALLVATGAVRLVRLMRIATV